MLRGSNVERKFGILVFWDLGNFEILEFGDLGFWDLGNSGIWEVRIWGVWDFGNLGIMVFGGWGCGDLGDLFHYCRLYHQSTQTKYEKVQTFI